MAPNLYSLERLTVSDLKLLYPSDNLYKKDYDLALHLTECLLVEDMEWEGDDAVGETAFWLKVLSSPKQKEYQLQKLQFKRDVYNKWLTNRDRQDDEMTMISNISPLKNRIVTPVSLLKSYTPPVKTTTTPAVSRLMNSTENITVVSKASSVQTPVPPVQMPVLPVQTLAASEEPENKRPRSLFEQTSPAKPTKIVTVGDDEVVDVTNIDDMESIVIDGTAMTAEEWAVIAASVGESTTTVVTETPHTDDSSRTMTQESSVVRRLSANPLNSDLLKIWPCASCSYKGMDRHDLDAHRFTEHVTLYPIACTEAGCNYRAKQMWILKRHLVSKHSTEKNFKCSACEYRAKTVLEVQRHIRSKHEKKVWKCTICSFECDATAPNKRHMHMAKVHGDKSNVHQCQSCDYYTTNRTSLVEHINANHSQSIKYWCGKGECQFWAYTKIQCRAHEAECNGERSISANNSRLFPRSKKPPNKSTKKRLTPVNRFWCGDCGMMFRSRQLANSHVERYHKNATYHLTNATRPGAMLFKCSLCFEESSQKLVIDDHLKSMHDGNAEIVAIYVDDPDYVPTYIKCTQCDFMTQTWCGMRSHIRGNHSTDVYSCDLCDYVTTAKSGLTNHKKTKHKTSTQPANQVNC